MKHDFKLVIYTTPDFRPFHWQRYGDQCERTNHRGNVSVQQETNLSRRRHFLAYGLSQFRKARSGCSDPIIINCPYYLHHVDLF